MRFVNKLINSPALHPLLFAISPVLALWATNSDRMRSIEVVLPLTLSVICSLILLLLLRLILRSCLKAGLLTSLAVLLFFSYGHIFGVLKALPGIGAQAGRHRYLAPLWILILPVGGYFILKYSKKATGLNLFLNCFGWKVRSAERCQLHDIRASLL